MNVVTQISGNTLPSNTPLRALKSMLALIGIHVAHSSRDESLFYEADSHAAWRRYDNELAFYSSIAHSPFHIIYNDGLIDKEIALQITYAMLKDRPILITGPADLSEKVSPFIRGVIARHVHSLHSASLSELELTELSLLLNKLKPTDYSLSKNEKVLINAQVKTHFRGLLEEAKQLRLTRSQVSLQPVEEN
ncbi:MAG: hypothetical protein JWP06_913 [Candidatus Saccharibacteria bacterium]|nr:hypothetical protein [Candidatus Saccharibacteria bacterium]